MSKKLQSCKGRYGMRAAIFTVVLVAIAGGVAAEAQTTHPFNSLGSPAVLRDRTSVATLPASGKRVLVISLQDHKLALIENGVVERIYPVAVGKTSTPSPSGEFRIARRVSDPTYAHKGRVVAAGPKNPVGSRWMGLNAKGYGIHGTNEPDSIGKAASHGCIRLGKADVEELFALTQVGDLVEIRSQRDATVQMSLQKPLPVLPYMPMPLAAPQRMLLAGNAGAPSAGTSESRKQ